LPRAACKTLSDGNEKMSKEELIQFEGLVIEILPDARYRVHLDAGYEVVAYTAGVGESTLSRKGRAVRATETPAQSGRALNSTYRPELIRVSGVLASNHVERKESQCKCLQSYRENDLSICSREGSLEQFS